MGNAAQVIFNEEFHQYSIEDKNLISVTQLMSKHRLAPDYSFVDQELLKSKAERGTYIHSEIEKYIKTGEIGFTPELIFVIEQIKKLKLKNLQSEVVVFNEKYGVAGTVDLIADKSKKRIMADYKTGQNVNIEPVRWQLSIYAYLWELMGNEPIDELYLFHLNDNPRVVKIEEIERAEVIKLLESELEGNLYQGKALIYPLHDLERLMVLEERIRLVDLQKKEYEEEQKKLKECIKNAMVEQAIKSWEFPDGSLKITYIAPQQRVGIDTTRLKKEMPEIAAQYEKITEVSDSVRITLRDKE
jgi:hypothetical protein